MAEVIEVPGAIVKPRTIPMPDPELYFPSEPDLEGGREAPRSGFDPIPTQLIARYIDAAMRRARTERFEDDLWYAEIPPLSGVWSEGDSQSEALATLKTVVEEWLAYKIEDRDRDIPELDQINLNWL